MTHKGTITLETERLILRRFTPEDAKAMFRNWASDPEVTKYLTWPTHSDVAVSEHVINDWISQYDKADHYSWAMELKSLGEPIGSIAAVLKNEDIQMVHIGYCLGKTWWRQGYTSEALMELLRFFFEEVGVNRVESRHDPRNPNSGKVMQKAGLRYEGTFRQSDKNNQDGFCDAAYYAILAEDYFNPKPQSAQNPDVKVINQMTDKQVFDIILSLAEKEDAIRAVLLEGSRANPNAVPDQWQDFDVAYVTTTNAPYVDGSWIARELLPHFGEIAVKQIPDNGDPNDVYTWLIQFANGIRIDLTFDSLEFLSRPDVKLESATVVLLDKDKRFADVAPSNESDYFPKRPTEREFSHCCNEFWWVSPYVAKALARGQTLLAIELLNGCVRCEYVKMLTWLAGAKTDFSMNFGKRHWNIGTYVPAPYYEALVKSHPIAESVAIGSSLAALVRAFPMLAADAAIALGYEYDANEGERTRRFLHEFYGVAASSYGFHSKNPDSV